MKEGGRRRGYRSWVGGLPWPWILVRELQSKARKGDVFGEIDLMVPH